jgi:geranylgeranyl diphosphate synthase type II
LQELRTYLDENRRRVEDALEEVLPPRHPDPGRLVEAMRYTLMLPAKRLRGIVCLTVAEALGSPDERVMPLSVAAEMVHAASLILDDLPAFDDARMRRGAATSHLVFGEPTAVLASIGLLCSGFRHAAAASRKRWLGQDDGVGVVSGLAEAVGESGMIAGEALDLLARGTSPGLEDLEKIHSMKTGSLFIGCAVEAGRVGGAGPDELAALRSYAKNLGLAFQITDDLLDVVGDPTKTGKDIGADEEGPSFVTFAGVDGARKLAEELVDTAVESLAPLGRRGARLEEIARFVARRDR